MVQVLIFPEDVEGAAPFEGAAYATINDARSGPPTAVLLSHPQGINVPVRRSVLATRAVPDGEFQDGALGELMRRAVVAINNETYVHGQVIGYDGMNASLTVRTRSGDITCDHATVSEVAPVVVFALSRAILRVADAPGDQLQDLQSRILDRIMGDNGEAPTRSISRILRGIVPARSQPRPTDAIVWLNGETGVDSTVTVRHAIDFAHFVDGGRQIPRSMEGQLGSSFDADPSQSGPRAPAQAAPLNGGISGEQGNDEESLESLLEALQPAPNNSPRLAEATPRVTDVRPDRGQDDASLQVRVLRAIADDPALVRYFLSQCEQQRPKRARDADDDDTEGVPGHRRSRLDGPSDLIDATEAADRSRQKHLFRPSRVQQAVHRLIAAPDHAGKSPVELMDAMISSKATRFLPHPGVLSRIFDFQFGIRGLSIMHFERFDFSARRRWHTQCNINLNNFGPTVDVPRARQPASLDDLANAFSVLQVFLDEFMDTHARRLVSTAKEFVEDLRGYSQWSAADIVTLAFWFDGVLEDFRRAVEEDVRHGTQSRRHIRDQFSFQDPQLQGVLYAIQSERFVLLQQPPGRRSSPPTPATTSHQLQGNQSRRGEPAPGSRIPPEVLEALPRQGDKTCCMRFLSNAGCFSRTPGRCTSSSRAHFVPVIPAIVRQFIDNNMKGVRTDIQQ